MEHRLPRSILPEAYDVRIAPDLDAHTFTGSVQVTANVVESTDVLVCNTLELELSDVMIDGEAVEWTIDEANEQLRVQLLVRLVDHLLGVVLGRTERRAEGLLPVHVHR